MDPEQRRAIYRDLRDALGISATEPMLPLPPAELAAWSRRYADLLVDVFSQRASTRGIADRNMLEPGLLDYARGADDAYLDSQIAIGVALRSTGLPSIYIHTIVNRVSLELAPRAAREVLPAASAAIVEERYPSAVLLRHALVQEGYFGASRISTGAP
jgi:hypothetical protein